MVEEFLDGLRRQENLLPWKGVLRRQSKKFWKGWRSQADEVQSNMVMGVMKGIWEQYMSI